MYHSNMDFLRFHSRQIHERPVNDKDTQSHGSGLARHCTVGKTTYMYVRMPIERKEYRRCLHFANAHLEAQATYWFSRMALHTLCPSQHIRKAWFSRYQLLTLSPVLPTFRPDALAFYALEKTSAFDCNVGKIANSWSYYLENQPFLMLKPAEKPHFSQHILRQIARELSGVAGIFVTKQHLGPSTVPLGYDMIIVWHPATTMCLSADYRNCDCDLDLDLKWE